MTDGFIKILRDFSVQELAGNDPNALCILMLATQRATWKGNPINGLKPGQAYMGYTDFPCMSRQQYRGACKRLLTYGFATIETTNKGTVVSLNGCGFADFSCHTTTTKPTIEQPSSNHQTTTREERKKERKKELKNTPLPPKGVMLDLWKEYLRTRTRLKAPNTDRAITTLTNKIEKLVAQGYDANELVELANTSGWKSVYPPQDNTDDRHKTATDIARDSSWADGMAAPNPRRGRPVRNTPTSVSELLPR